MQREAKLIEKYVADRPREMLIWLYYSMSSPSASLISLHLDRGPERPLWTYYHTVQSILIETQILMLHAL